MRMTILATVLGGAMMFTAAAMEARAADTASPAHTKLSLSAFGEISVPPDRAYVALGVVDDAPTAADAYNASARHSANLVAALIRAGVPERSIRTSSVSLQPIYVVSKVASSNAALGPRSYRASNEVTVTVDQVDRVGPLADSAIAAGANRVNGITFTVKERQRVEDEARLLAVRSLEAKAKTYAQAIGARQVSLKALNESDGGGLSVRWKSPLPVDGALVGASPAIAIEPGELTLRITVQGEFELD